MRKSSARGEEQDTCEVRSAGKMSLSSHSSLPLHKKPQKWRLSRKLVLCSVSDINWSCISKLSNISRGFKTSAHRTCVLALSCQKYFVRVFEVYVLFSKYSSPYSFFSSSLRLFQHCRSCLSIAAGWVIPVWKQPGFHDTDLYSPRIHFSSKSIRKRFNAIFGYSVRSDTAECYSTWQWERHGLKIKSRMVESLRRDKNRYSLPPLQEPKEKQSLMCLISWMYYSDRSISILRNQSTLERKYITNCKVHCERSPFFKLNLPIDMFVLICLWG